MLNAIIFAIPLLITMGVLFVVALHVFEVHHAYRRARLKSRMWAVLEGDRVEGNRNV